MAMPINIEFEIEFNVGTDSENNVYSFGTIDFHGEKMAGYIYKLGKLK